MRTVPVASAVVAALVLAFVIAYRRDALAVGEALAGDGTAPLPDDPTGIGAEQDQGAPWWDSALSTIDPTNYWPAMNDDNTQQLNRAAFLMALRKAEGTAGPNGYRTMFGGRLFDGWADHPRKPMQFTDQAGRRLWTSAAGAYQFMAVSPIPGGGSTRVNTWDRVRDKLGLPDFSPASQDLAALELIRENGALNDVDAGRFDAAVAKVRSTWASLPGAGYAQPERSIEYLRTAYTDAGGTLA